MHIKDTVQHLFTHVSLVQGAVDKRNTIPVLSNILIEADANSSHATLSSTNLETGMSVFFPVESCTDLSATIPAQKLFEILRELPGDEMITLTCDPETYRWTLERPEGPKGGKRGSFKIAGLSAQDFPDLPTPSTDNPITLSGPVLDTALNHVIGCVSHDEIRYALIGVYVEVTDGTVQLTATDGHRCNTTTIQKDKGGEHGGYIVPSSACKEIKKLSAAHDDLVLSFSENQLIVVAGAVTLMTRLIDATFPDYRQVIPTNHTYQVELLTDEYRQALRRVMLLCADTRLIKHAFSTGSLSLTGIDPNLGEAHETLALDYEGHPFDYGLNGRYVLDMLTHFHGSVRFQTRDAQSPALFTDPDGKVATQAVIMPMRV